MTVSPVVHPTASPAPTAPSLPKLDRHYQKILVSAEGANFEATAELVHQRHDLDAALCDENDRALDGALSAIERGDYALAKHLIRVAQAAEDREDAATRRAQRRRESAHGHQRKTAKRLEFALTGRSRD